MADATDSKSVAHQGVWVRVPPSVLCTHAIEALMRTTDRLVWLDMEMSGLDPERERVLELAVLITDGDLNVIAEGPELVVHQPDSVLDAMDEWNTKHHGESGLVDRVRSSTVTEAQADLAVLEFLRAHVEAKAAPLAGNSIHQDRLFITRYLPLTDAHLHYRMVDVSTVKELAKRWKPELYESAPKKSGAHRAMADIVESINELRYYRDTFFKL